MSSIGSESGGGPDPRVGTLLDGRYRLVRRIGKGGRGVVYEARHEEMGRRVAIKLLAPELTASPEGLERFRREARAAGRLNHQNVVLVHDFVAASGASAYLVMELCDGGNLADEVERDGKVSPERTAEVIEAVAAAVEAAHRAGIVHRDLKPANILFQEGRPKVADFGLATLAADEDPASSLTGEHAVGSPHYMSPEQCAGQTADARSDVYGLGVIAYEMLTGFVPFTGATVMSILMKHLTERPQPPAALEPTIPAAASAAILRALAKEPDLRFASARELAAALGAALRPAGGGHESRASTKPVAAITLVSAVEADTPIGREAPLGVMSARLVEALRGRGGFLLISGEPGAGKTTLAQAFLSRELAARPEIRSATGRCSEHYGSGEAYLPFLEIASRLASSLDDGRAVGFLRTLAPTWCQHLPALARGVTAEEGRERTVIPALDRMPREFTDFLSALSTVRPLVLLLEDLHWADNASVDLLAYLARRIGEMRLLVVATYRPTEIEVLRHPLRQALRGLSASSSMSAEIAPLPFTPAEVQAFLVRELNVPVDPEIVAFVHRKTEGNPLFVLNLLRHLNDTGAIRVEEGRASPARPLAELSGEVPQGINGVILSRLEGLDEADRRLLQVASVQGETFDSAALAAALSGDELEIEERLDRLHRVHRLVEPAGETGLPEGWLTACYRFVHAFYQATLYGSITPKRRAAWHQAIGLFLLERAGHTGEAAAAALAVHFERGHDYPRAIDALERAAETSARRNPREAGPLLVRAVDLCDRLAAYGRLSERARLLTRLGRHYGETAEIVGDVGLYDRAEAAVFEALKLDPEGHAAPEAQTTLGLVRLERGENERALADLSSVVARWPRHAPAHAALAYLFKNTGLWDRALAAQDAAAAIDRRFAHSIPRLSVLIYRGDFAAAHAESDALLGERPNYSHFNYWKGIVYFYEGSLAAARHWIERGYHLDPDNFIARGVMAVVLATQGERNEARRLLALAEPGAAADGTFTYWIAKARAALGDLSEAVDWVARAEAIGYWNAPWIAKDRALEALQGLPAFQTRLRSIERRQLLFRELAEAEGAMGGPKRSSTG